MTVKPGKRDEVIALLLRSGKLFNDNPACTLYLVYKDKGDPEVIWVEDVWTDQADHTTVMNEPEMRPYISKCMPLLKGAPEQTELTFIGEKGLQ